MTPFLKAPLAAALILMLGACGQGGGGAAASGDATAPTVAANAAFEEILPLNERQSFEDAQRGFIARPEGKILGADGSVLIDFDAFKFVDGEAPPTVNPSLWRHAQLNAQIGLFKVTDGIYQLRGFDIGNMTLIEGKTGWIVVDTLTAAKRPPPRWPSRASTWATSRSPRSCSRTATSTTSAAPWA